LPDCSLDDVATLELEALDDRAPRATSFIEVSVDKPVDMPTLPTDVSMFIARGRTRDGSVVALGLFSVRDGRAHGPLFRSATACALRGESGARAAFPPLLSPVVAASARFGILTGGRDGDGAARSDTIVVDGERGVATRLGLRRRRSGAAVAITGDTALVAGGAAGAELWEDAEIIALDRGEVLADPIRLAEKRADAAAVTLANGEVLIVGGRGPAGATATLEALHPARPIARTLDLASLSRPRRSPIALRLATGEVVVLGGVDDTGNPIDDVDVLDPLAAKRLGTLTLKRRATLSAIALPSGAALVVTSEGASSSAFLVRADGVEALPSPSSGGLLIAATDGAPFLFNGAFRRFDPFGGVFLDVPMPPNLAIDPQIPPFAVAHGVLAVPRIEDSALVIRALRYDARPPLISEAGALGLGSTAHLSADRPGVMVGRDGLVMPSRARVTVADATYLGMSLRLSATGRDRPAVELREEGGAIVARVDDDGACAWPTSDASASEIVREPDGELVVRVGAAERRCGKHGTARVLITLVAGSAEARVRGATITRR